MAQKVKASTYSIGDLGMIPGPGRSLEEEMATSGILAWRIPMGQAWYDCSPWGNKSDTTEASKLTFKILVTELA